MILVTGATGFLGRRVVRALSQAGHGPLRLLVHRARTESPLQGAAVEAVAGDVRDPASLRRAMEGVRVVVHLVAIIREGGRGETYQTVNHLGTKNVVEAARETGVERLVHVSAIGAGPEPRRRYGYSKWQGEQEVVRSGVPYAILRPSILFGEGDGFFTTLAAVARLFPLAPVAGSGRNLFQPIHVEDVARCVATLVGAQGYVGRTIEIGGPQQYTYNQLMGVVAKALGVRRPVLHTPVPVMRLVAGLMELTTPRPPVTREELSYLDLDNVADLDSVERHFGFSPRPLLENLGYLRGVGFKEALAINLGRRPGS